jgi:isopenicillin-N N-acyltransferase like protein
MIVVDCSGSGRARGLAHGEGARAAVKAALERWAEATLAARKGTTILDYARALIGSTGLIATMARLVPDLLDEVGGIAEGAAQPFELVAAYNLMDEQWWYDLDAEASELGCSIIGLSDGDGTTLSQNMDLPRFMDGSQIVLRLENRTGLRTLLLSSAGLIGLTGVNSAGVAVCVNTLLMLRSDPDGLPVAAAMRHALAQRSKGEAVRALRAVPHASGQHYAVADRSGMVGLECSAAGCAESSACGSTTLLHTNHPLASVDLDPRALDVLTARGRVRNSKERLVYLDGWHSQGRRAEDIQPLLADPATPISVTATPERSSQTFGSVVFCVAAGIEASFCLARPGSAPWRNVPF